MLPAAARMRSSEEFTAVVRSGRSAGSSTLVLHALRDPDESDSHSPRVGLIVGGGVGGAVLRNRTRRRLRHLMRDRLRCLPASGRLVVRALGPAGAASTSTLAGDLDRCLARVWGSAS